MVIESEIHLWTAEEGEPRWGLAWLLGGSTAGFLNKLVLLRQRQHNLAHPAKVCKYTRSYPKLLSLAQGLTCL